MSYSNSRIYIIIAILLAIGAAVESRLFYLQVYRGQYYKVLAEDKGGILKFLPKRGNIYFTDRFGNQYPAALTTQSFDVYAVPQEIKDPREISLALGSIINETSSILLERLSNHESAYVPLQNRVSQELADKIRRLGMTGIGLEETQDRSYPFGVIAANVLGFLSYADVWPKGQYGLEEFYNDGLTGLAKLGAGDLAAKVGDSLVLTIDYNIQRESEKVLDALTEKFKTKDGTVIVMDPKSGAILTMASRPTFNPNEYSKVDDLEVFKNRATQNNYEPGSIFKIFAMAVGLEKKVITPGTIYHDEGQVEVGDVTIRNYDAKAHGYQTMTQVLEKSLNTGAVFVMSQLNKKDFLNYLKDFGFDSKTKVDLVGEAKGDISNLKKFNDVDYATVSFGQGVSVTALQLLTAVSVVANEGKLMKPYLVDKIIDYKGEIETTKPQAIAQPIKPLTASQLTAMLVSVAENGLDKKAFVSGYHVAVKTGTAQIAKPGGGGYTDDTIHTIIGFAPAVNPRFAILISLDKPQGLRFASDTLTPAFNELTKFLLNYYEIPPQL